MGLIFAHIEQTRAVFALLKAKLICTLLIFHFGANAQYQLNGSAVQTSCECYELTPNTGAMAGSVWNVTQIDLTQPFDFTFEIFLGCNTSNSGADGMAFVLQPLSVNAGAGAGGIGYGGITPSLAIEFDTFENTQYADGPDDHIAIMSNGVVDHNLANNLAGPVSASSTTGNVEDCSWHTVQIVWDPVLTTIAVFFDGVFRTAYFGDIVTTIFGGDSMVYWGWTGSTGWAFNQHQFCISLQPDFAPSTATACVGEQIDFTESSSASNVIQAYDWNFGDNTTASGQNVSHTYATGGQYDVTLTITSDGCTESVTQQITINDLPVVDLGPDVDVCDGQSIQLNSPNTVGAGTYAWSPATELNNTGIASPTSTPSTNRTYTLDFTDVNGCSNSDDITVNFNPLPTANAGFDVGFCTGGSIQLNASGGISYSWDNVGTLNNSNVQNPVASPAASTIYTVTVADANNCENTDDVEVTVHPLPSIDAGPDLTVCEGFGTQLNVFGVGTVQWNADPTLSNTSIPNPMATPSVTTTYIATLTDLNNCESSDDVTVNVVTVLPVDAGPDQAICIGETIQLGATGAVSYSWDPALDLDNPNIANPTFSGTSDVTITLTGTDGNGCLNTDEITITVNPLPNADAGGDQSICIGESATLGASGGVSYVWDNGGTLSDGLISGPEATPVVTTTYEVTVTDANNCVNTDQIEVTVNPLPTVDAGADVSICDGESIQLSAVGVGSFSWSNSGSLDNTDVADPNASPSVTTTYTVTLTDANNCTISDDVELTVFETPVAILNDPVPVCNGSTMLFPDNSTGPIVSWDWEFGDNTQGVGENPTHIYPGVGSYDLSLTISSQNNCFSTATATAQVITGPVAQITVNNGLQFCENDCVEFDAGASTGPIVNYNWDLGTASATSADSATSYCYQIEGSYDVSLIVSTADGCADTIMQAIPVNPNPVAVFSSTVACEGEDTEFTDLSTVANGFVATYNWHFGDLAQSDQANPEHGYDQLGSYNVMLAIATQMGCVDTIFNQVTVNQTPVVSIASSSVCEGLATEFTNSTIPADNTIASWDWDFGDAQVSVDQTPTHQYAQFGSYETVLTATTVEGCTSSDTISSEVFAVPVADFEASVLEGCQPLGVQFYNNSTIANGQLDHFIWNLGDSNYLEAVAPDITYVNDGLFDISMIAVAEDGGCSDTLTIAEMIRVNVTPEASFTMSPTEEITMLDPRVKFVNTSADALNYEWDFGDGQSSTEMSPTHDYGQTGAYEIQLRAINNACEDVAIAEVKVHPETFIYVPNALTPNNDGVNDTFKPEGLGVEQYTMFIHDRWGKEMFQTSNWEEAWDGTHKGRKVPQGVYVYRIDVVTVRRLQKVYQGSVTVAY